MGMVGLEIIEPPAAVGAQSAAVRAAQRGHRQRRDDLVPDDLLQVDPVVHEPRDLVLLRRRRGGRVGVGEQLADRRRRPVR